MRSVLPRRTAVAASLLAVLALVAAGCGGNSSDDKNSGSGGQDAPDATDLEVPHGEVRFEHVTFGYTSADPVLRDFDLTVAAGETVAQLLEGYPRLTEAGIRAALDFAAKAIRADVVYPIGSSA